MAVVTLTKLWLHEAADLSEYRSWYSTDRRDGRDQAGEVREYANGRRRLVTTPAKAQKLGVTVRLVTDDDLVWLDDHAGTLLMLRDHRGRVVFGSYFTLDIVDYDDQSGYDVSFAFESVTYSVEV